MSSSSRGPSRGRAVRLGLCATALVAMAVAGPGAGPASAAPVIQAQGIALDISATCEKGNVNITYDGSGISRQVADFTAQDGTLLDLYDVPAYKPSYDGLEYVLTKAGSTRGGKQPVPTTGTILGVYVMLGDVPPVAANAEFFLLYRCDTTRNDQGGTNVVLQTCFGPYGTCPKTAQDALPPPPQPGPPSTEPPPPAPGALVPAFTG